MVHQFAQPRQHLTRE